MITESSCADTSIPSCNKRGYCVVIIDETPDELVVVTVYRTSQIAKYLKGVQP